MDAPVVLSGIGGDAIQEPDVLMWRGLGEMEAEAARIVVRVCRNAVHGGSARVGDAGLDVGTAVVEEIGAASHEVLAELLGCAAGSERWLREGGEDLGRALLRAERIVAVGQDRRHHVQAGEIRTGRGGMVLVAGGKLVCWC